MAYQTRTASGLDTPRDDPWEKSAACADEDPELMHPFPNLNPGELWLIREVCFGCTVKLECLKDGVDAADWESVRGGLTGRERAKHHRAGLEPHEYPKPVQPTCVRCRKPTWLPLRRGLCGSCRVAEARATKRMEAAA